MGRSPLYEAILNKHLNIVKELKNAGGKLIANYDDITNLLLNIGFIFIDFKDTIMTMSYFWYFMRQD
jgi:hypothetical protein